jgi:uncharacterized protein (TIGR02145 family)
MLTNLAYGGVEAGVELTSGAGQNTTNNIEASGTNWNRVNPPYNNQKQWVDPTNPAVTQGNGTRCTTAYRTSAASVDYTECGYIYNWCAALGNSSASCSVASGDVADAGADICPTGWRLPTGDSNGELQSMYSAIGGTHADLVGISSTWRGVYSGGFDPGTGLVLQSDGGRYWAGTANSSIYGYHLSFNDSTVNAANSYNKGSGYAIRCVTAY